MTTMMMMMPPSDHVVVAVFVLFGSLTSAVHGARCADAVDCLVRAAAAGLHALARSADPVDLVPGCVTLVKDADGAAAVAGDGGDGGDTPSPRSAGAELVRSVAAFVGSRAVVVRAPVRLLRSVERTLAEARGKKDKYAGPLLMGAMMVAGTLLPIKLGALAMMSGKALMTSMLALMLSAILALKKLASGGGGGGGGGGGTTTYEVINVPSPSGHGAHGRSLAHGSAYGRPVQPTAAADA